jgi:hypothetical protein
VRTWGHVDDFFFFFFFFFFCFLLSSAMGINSPPLPDYPL